MAAVDYSWARPSIADLQAARVTDVFRYVGPPAWGKTIAQSEYDSLVAGGIRVWLNFEYGANDSAGGYAAGKANAVIAAQYTPTGYAGPTFFSCDEPLAGASLDTAVEYVHGASDAMGVPKTGVYGEGALLQAVKDAGYAEFFWQSASTSYAGNAVTLPFVQVQQTVRSILPGTDLDLVLLPLVPPQPLVSITARPLYPGDFGSDVASLQGAINAHISAGSVPGAVAVPITGHYDAATVAVVRAFQDSRRMTPVGHCGQETLQHLYGPA